MKKLFLTLVLSALMAPVVGCQTDGGRESDADVEVDVDRSRTSTTDRDRNADVTVDVNRQ